MEPHYDRDTRPGWSTPLKWLVILGGVLFALVAFLKLTLVTNFGEVPIPRAGETEISVLTKGMDETELDAMDEALRAFVSEHVNLVGISHGFGRSTFGKPPFFGPDENAFEANFDTPENFDETTFRAGIQKLASELAGDKLTAVHVVVGDEPGGVRQR